MVVKEKPVFRGRALRVQNCLYETSAEFSPSVTVTKVKMVKGSTHK